jgi:hypothetical protein
MPIWTVRSGEGGLTMEDKRLDYPVCPYCGYQLVGFCPPDGDIRKATLYCESGECRGRGLQGTMNGYDIAFTDLKNTYSTTITYHTLLGSFLFKLAMTVLRRHRPRARWPIKLRITYRGKGKPVLQGAADEDCKG